MAISPISPRFLTQSRERDVNRFLTNFAIRTKQRIPTTAGARLIEAALPLEQEDIQARARAAIELREQSSRERFRQSQIELAHAEQRRKREEKKSEEHRRLGSFVGGALGGATGIPGGSVVGSIIGGIVGGGK